MTLPLGLQDVVVVVLAAAALGWLVWRRVRSARRGGDAACENCPSGKPIAGVRPAPQPEVLLSIGEPRRDAGGDAPRR